MIQVNNALVSQEMQLMTDGGIVVFRHGPYLFVMGPNRFCCLLAATGERLWVRQMPMDPLWKEASWDGRCLMCAKWAEGRAELNSLDALSGELNEPLIAKTKELYDGALPSGNSVAALNLVRLSQLAMDQSLRQMAERQLQAFSATVAQMPHAFPQFLIGLDLWLGPSQEIVIAGDPAAADIQRMIRAVSERFLPRAAVVVHPTGAGAVDIERLIPFVKTQGPLNGKPTLYLCEHYVCKLPVTTPDAVEPLLDALR